MSTYLGSQLLSGVATNTISNAHSLLDFKWTDHILNEMSWLRADTFSWHNGDVYIGAYNHLVADYNGGTSQTETVGSYTITYKLATDGHKITTDETTVANIYNESGVAWYYVIDTANQRFKLPRTKYGFTGLRDTVGNNVEAGLPNITGSFHIHGYYYGYDTIHSPTDLFTVENDNTNDNRLDTNDARTGEKVTFDASNHNPIYGKSTTVQPPATQMYLYFYVGQFSQSATEQTAGLNAELFNGKLDLDLGNITNVSKETIVGWGMPDYSAGVAQSGASFTAPSDGWVYIIRSTPKDSALKADIDNVSVWNCMNRGYMAGDMTALIPIAKGSSFSGVNGSSATFFPCKGV